MYTIDPNDKRDPSQRAYDYLMGGESYRNPYLNYADTAGTTPAMPSTKDIGDNHWEYDALTKAWRLVAGKSAEAAAEAPKTVADVNEQYQKASGSSAPFGRDSEGNALNAPQTNLSDEDWSAVKRMRDEQGFFNPYEMANLKAFGAVALGGIGGIPTAYKQGQIAQDALQSYKSSRGIGNDQYGADAYGLSALRSGYGTGGGGGFMPISIGGDAIDAVGSGEQAAAENLKNPEVQAAIQNQAPVITDAMREAAIREGGGTSSGSGWTYTPYTPTASETGDAGDSGDGSGWASGGMASYAAGGLGSLGSYSDGGQLLRGPGDGVSDGIPAVIGKGQPAKLADGEFVLPARIVSELGNGSTEAGAKKLYAMMDRIEKAQRNAKRGKDSKADKYLPA
jgi:hypothetical protein